MTREPWLLTLEDYFADHLYVSFSVQSGPLNNDGWYTAAKIATTLPDDAGVHRVEDDSSQYIRASYRRTWPTLLL